MIKLLSSSSSSFRHERVACAHRSCTHTSNEHMAMNAPCIPSLMCHSADMLLASRADLSALVLSSAFITAITRSPSIPPYQEFRSISDCTRHHKSESVRTRTRGSSHSTRRRGSRIRIIDQNHRHDANQACTAGESVLVLAFVIDPITGLGVRYQYRIIRLITCAEHVCQPQSSLIRVCRVDGWKEIASSGITWKSQ